MMVDPSAHPQHMNGLEHFVYVWSGCGNHSRLVWGLNHSTLASFEAQVVQSSKSSDSLNSAVTSMVVVAWWWTHLLIHSIWMVSYILHMYGVDMGTIPCGSGAQRSTIAHAHWHHWKKEHSQLPKLCGNKYGGSDVMVDPSAHSQHMTGFKHFVYVWCGCGNHSMWLWGLNHYTLTSFIHFP